MKCLFHIVAHAKSSYISMKEHMGCDYAKRAWLSHVLSDVLKYFGEKDCKRFVSRPQVILVVPGEIAMLIGLLVLVNVMLEPRFFTH
jgi:hypothetical protein